MHLKISNEFNNTPLMGLVNEWGTNWHTVWQKNFNDFFFTFYVWRAPQIRDKLARVFCYAKITTLVFKKGTGSDTGFINNAKLETTNSSGL